MSAVLSVLTERAANPLDIVEQIIAANEWNFDRRSDCEMAAEAPGKWCDFGLYFCWSHDISAMHFTCAFDLKVPEKRRPALYELLALANGEGASFRSFRAAAPASPDGSPTPNALGGPSGRFGQTPEQVAARAMQGKKMQMIYEEGAAFVLEPGRGDGGTVFVSQASMPPRGAGGPGDGPAAPLSGLQRARRRPRGRLVRPRSRE